MLCAVALWQPSPAQAGEANVIAAKLSRTGIRVYKVDVTIRHGDEGWQHYVDKFDVIAPNGHVLGTRILYHPHVDEQPFTRSLTGLHIPGGIERVTIRAHDKVHGYGGRTVKLEVKK